MKQLMLLCVLIFVSCKSDPQPVENTSDTQEKAYTIKAEDIENLKYTDYVLSPDSSQAILDWQLYQDLQNNIELLKGGNLSFFRVEKGIMEEFISEMKMQQPPVVVTPAIRSRMTVLETNILKLQNLSNLDNIKKQDFLEAIRELLIADANLKLQMNKKFEKEAQQIQLPVKTEQ
ncbi:hypothetical protein [uncultured Gelidibacter sp.]|uniref:hypothetical protein n=1 Tax=uncultured Gelidibacter sp. TaxID=259318 RepID=UPI00260219FE|nr:hypothetical protein [uncultured Gelidibacter sp.]